MPWFNVCDTFAFDEKAVAAGNAAIGLWARAGSWSAQQLTDGFVPRHMVTALGGSTSQVRRLVDVGLWQKADGGYQFVDWNSAQSTRKEVEQQRAAARERMRRLRADGRSGEHAASVRGEVRPNMTRADGGAEERSQGIQRVDQTAIVGAGQGMAEGRTASAQVTDLGSRSVRPNTARTSPAVTPTRTRPSPSSSPSPPEGDDVANGDSGGGGGSTPNEDLAACHMGAAEVLDALASPWRLGPQAIARLKPTVARALDSGWNPQNLAAHLGGNPDGVRNSYAVLAARLGDLPPPPASRPSRPVWCGNCDETTRMRETDDNRPYRCADCHPGANRARAPHPAADAHGAA